MSEITSEQIRAAARIAERIEPPTVAAFIAGAFRRFAAAVDAGNDDGLRVWGSMIDELLAWGGPAVEPQPAQPPVPCPEGFHWIGQTFASCDKCGLPAWEHEGNATLLPNAGPFSDGNEWVLDPWEPGEREKCRTKWGGVSETQDGDH